MTFRITKFLNCNNAWMVSISLPELGHLYFHRKDHPHYIAECLVLMISSFSIRVIISLEFIFFDNIGLTIFKMSCYRQYFLSFPFPQNRNTVVPLFHGIFLFLFFFLLLRNLILSSVLNIIVLDSFFHKRQLITSNILFFLKNFCI